MAAHSPGVGAAALRRLARLIQARCGLILGVSLLLVLASILASALWLRMRPGYVDLLDPASPLQARYLALLEEFGNVEALHVVVTSPSPGAAAATVDAIAQSLPGLTDSAGQPVVARFLARLDVPWILAHAPALLPAQDAARLAEAEASGAGPLSALRADPGMSGWLDWLGGQVEAAVGGRPAAAFLASGADAGASPGTIASLLEAMTEASLGQAATPTTWFAPRLAALAGMDTDAKGRIRLGPDRYLLTVTPRDVSNDAAVMQRFLEAVRHVADEAALAAEAPVTVAFTGAPALVVDEMRSARRDVLLSTAISVLLVVALFACSFRSPRRIAFAVVTLLSGLALTFGAALVLVGSLNLFSTVFAAILAGLGIDFCIHIVSHHEAARAAGAAESEAVAAALVSAGPPTALGAVTTAVAFFSITASGFRGFAQLGLIAGTGILLCLLLAFTLLPALLLRWPPRTTQAAAPAERRWADVLLRAVPRRAWLIASVGGVALLASGYAARDARFDHDLMNLQPEGTEAVRLQGRDGHEAVATHLAFSVADSLAEAASLGERFAALPSVAAVHSVASFVPVPDPQRQTALARLAGTLAVAPALTVAAGSTPVMTARGALERLADALQEAQDLAFDAGRASETEALDLALAACRRLATALDSPSASRGVAAWRTDSERLVGSMLAALPALAESPLTPADLPLTLASHFVGRTGRLAVIVQPRGSIWDRPELERFVGELRSVDPSVTGPPIQVLEITETMRRSVLRASAVALLVITLLVIVGLRSLAGAAIALGALGMGVLLMMGLLAAFDVPLNPANLIALPLVLGIGVDGGIHVAHRWLRERSASAALREVGHPLVVTSLTTVAGFAALLFASHRGVRSLGVVACVGSLAMLVSAVVLLPALLTLVERRRQARG